MVDESAEDRSSSAIFYHGVKSASVVRKYWMIQKDDTIFPKCEFTPDDFFSNNHKSWKNWLWNFVKVFLHNLLYQPVQKTFYI